MRVNLTQAQMQQIVEQATLGSREGVQSLNADQRKALHKIFTAYAEGKESVSISARFGEEASWDPSGRVAIAIIKSWAEENKGPKSFGQKLHQLFSRLFSRVSSKKLQEERVFALSKLQGPPQSEKTPETLITASEKQNIKKLVADLKKAITVRKDEVPKELDELENASTYRKLKEVNDKLKRVALKYHPDRTLTQKGERIQILNELRTQLEDAYRNIEGIYKS